MKTLTIELPDDIYERAERRAAELGSSLTKELMEMAGRLGSSTDDDALHVARQGMQELFGAIRGAHLSPKIPREELYERGTLPFPIWPDDMPLCREEMYDSDGR